MKLSASFHFQIQKLINYLMKQFQQTNLMIGTPKKEKRRMRLDFKTCLYLGHKKLLASYISFQVSVNNVCATQKGNTTNREDKVGPCQFFDKWKETRFAYFTLLCSFLLRSILISSSSTSRVGSSSCASAGLNAFLAALIF